MYIIIIILFCSNYCVPESFLFGFAQAMTQNLDRKPKKVSIKMNLFYSINLYLFYLHFFSIEVTKLLL